MQQLSEKELYRLTDTKDRDEQVAALKRLGIHHHERRIGGNGLLIGINVYDTEVQKHLSAAQWLAISDF